MKNGILAIMHRTLASLLDAQPRGLKKYPDHRLLWDRFMASEKLQRLRISPRCYRLLNNAKIPPGNLPAFYRTYRLPEDPFFPLFLSVKSQWIADRRKWKEDREDAIRKMMDRLPAEQRRTLETLAGYEESHHPRGGRPIWKKKLYPVTMKRARELTALDQAGWNRLVWDHLAILSERYPSIPHPGDGSRTGRLWAAIVLGCRSEDPRDVQGCYRRKSKTLHPDRGGDADAFRYLKTARDLLLGG